MSDLNALYLQGRLTKDASLNTLSNGSAVATLSLAVNKDYLDSSTNEWKKITNFFDVSYWGESAKKNLSEYTKGREVLVEAELKTSSWEKDGKKFSRVEIRATRVRALRRPGEGKHANVAAKGTRPASQGYSSPAPEAPDFDDVPPEMYDENGERIPF
ncbi:MAG: single-stranded DNA-binding protein [Treponema succinifaciens]|uniref:single-stranded DNA-binding protein n=1 Tax=Treponema succinifaciens TaxID=167 RepID=UPI002357B1E5|nr:single-stranded DNA-binding protein [Treponema succinifaciens]MCI6912972.1 single-stranded DNA-binding protein [Treponema succinifaciens]